MICPFCGYSETKVIDSRDTNDGKATRRRRECEKCQARFSTYEEVEIMRLVVIKRNGDKQEYDQEKIKVGIKKALEKRPVNEEKIDKLLGCVEYNIHTKESNEITSREIGRIILDELRKIDDVAYLRFASVYKSFGSADSFKKELKNLKK